MKISLVIPALNESAIIRDTAAAAESYLSREFDDYEILIINDGSRDDTGEIINALASDTVVALGYGDNRGKGHAVRTGILAATGDIIVCTDADLAYGLEVIKPAVERLIRSERDMVIGSRRISGGGYGEYPAMRLIASKCFSMLLRAVSGMRYDTQCGFKCFRAETAKTLFADCRENGFAFDFEVLSLATCRGLKIEQMGVTIVNHRQSDVRLVRDTLRMLRAVYGIRRRLSARS